MNQKSQAEVTELKQIQSNAYSHPDIPSYRKSIQKYTVVVNFCFISIVLIIYYFYFWPFKRFHKLKKQINTIKIKWIFSAQNLDNGDISVPQGKKMLSCTFSSLKFTLHFCEKFKMFFVLGDCFQFLFGFFGHNRVVLLELSRT